MIFPSNVTSKLHLHKDPHTEKILTGRSTDNDLPAAQQMTWQMSFLHGVSAAQQTMLTADTEDDLPAAHQMMQPVVDINLTNHFRSP